MSVGGEYSDTAVVVPGGDMVTVCNVHHSTLEGSLSSRLQHKQYQYLSDPVIQTLFIARYVRDVISIHPYAATKQLYTERISTKHLAVFNVKLSPGRAITINMIGGVPPPPPPLALAHGFTFLLAAVSNSDSTFSPFRINMSLRIKVIFHAKLVS